jgi:hypothetical protein
MNQEKSMISIPRPQITNPFQATFRTPVGVSINGAAAHFFGGIMMKVLGASDDFVSKAEEAAAKPQDPAAKNTFETHIVKKAKTEDKPKTETKVDVRADGSTEQPTEVKTEQVWREVSLSQMLAVDTVSEVIEAFKQGAADVRQKMKAATVEDAVTTIEVPKNQ